MVETLIADNIATHTEIANQTETYVKVYTNLLQELLDDGIEPGRELFEALNDRLVKPSRWAYSHPANVVYDE